MTCSTNGPCCNICPGMLIAGALMLVTLIQMVFFRPSAPKQTGTKSTNQSQESIENVVKID